MSPLLWLFLGAVGVAGASYFYKSWHSRTLGSTSDEEFLRLYRKTYSDSVDLVLKERQIIAEHLGLPAERIVPDDTFKKLCAYTGFVGEYEVGMGDLEEELRELCKRASLNFPQSFPETIGQLIHQMVAAKEIIQSKSLGKDQ